MDTRNILRSTPWDPTVPHCMEERRYIGSDGTDGGGHSSCLEVLQSDGTCPLWREHHSEWIKSGLSQNDWAHEVWMTRPRWSYVTLEVATRNSRYDLCIGSSYSNLECISGTYGGQDWNARPLLKEADGDLFDLKEVWEQAATNHLRRADEMVAHLIGEPIIFMLLPEGQQLTTSNVVAINWRIG